VRRLKFVVCLLSLYLGACGRTTPDIPVPQLNGVVPAVRERIQSAADQARKRPNDAQAVGRYGMILEAHDQFSLAVPVLSRAARLEPDRFDWLYYLAIAYGNLGKSQEAIAAMDKALRIEPDYIPLRLRHAEALLAQGNADAGKAEYQRVIAENPNDAAAHLGLGRAFAAAGDYASAVREDEAACSLFPPYAAAHYAAAQAYRRLGDAKRADREQQLYSESNQLAPPTDDWRLDRMRQLNAGAEQYLQRSLALAAAGRLDEAVQANLDALKIDPSLVLAHVNLISLYAQLGRPNDAEQHYRSAVALAPNRADAYYNYGVLLVHLGRQREALEAFRKAVELDPRHADAQVNYGFLLEQNGDIADAMKHYAIAATINPKHRLARYHLGRLLIGRGRPLDAVEQFKQILEPEGPDSAEIYYGLATAYVRAGNLPQALACTRHAYALAKANHEGDMVDRIGHDLHILEARLGH
jgi:tetratricopeptide (TPR) repeat protein